jgi:membrane protein implicated in regulation of membrane protease activity
LIHNIPNGLLFSPRYYPQMDTYLSSMYQIYYAVISGFLYNYEDVLQIAILLNRMKIFSPFVRKHFTASPKIISLIFLLVSSMINLPILSAFKIGISGDGYVYYDTNNKIHFAIYYFPVSSDFSATLFGKIFLGFTSFLLNALATLIVGLVLNVVSVYQYRSYLEQKRQRDEEYNRASYTNTQQTVEFILPQRREITQKEINDRRAENNMFYMALTLSFISVITRIFFMLCFIYFFFYASAKDIIYISFTTFLVHTFVPSIAIFVFYSFNKMFRDEFKQRIVTRLKEITNASTTNRTLTLSNVA